MLRENQLNTGVMIDCSHGNSGKNHERQSKVVDNIAGQIKQGQFGIIGVMLESHLVSGQQSFDERPLNYGQSITDACIGWEETEVLLENIAKAVQQRGSIQ